MQKIKSIEGLRGILALWVVFGHTVAAAGLSADWRGPFKVLATGGYAVDAFIIISGFVIFYLLDSAPESYGRFIWRRFLRLYPVYLICLLASALLLHGVVAAYANAPWFHPLNISRLTIANNSLSFLPQHLAAHLVMAHSLIPDWLLPSSNYAILGVAWSLSLEWQFYVLAPLLFAAFAKGPRLAIPVILMTCALHFLIAGNDGFLPKHLPMFALGIASYYLWRHAWRPQWPLLMPVGVALAYLLTHSPPVVVWSAVFLAAYQPDATGARLLTRILESRPALLCGRLSYSVYLTHSMLLVIAMLILENAGMARFGQWPFFAVLAAMTVSATLVISWLLYNYVEKPFIALGKRRAVVAAIPTPPPSLRIVKGPLPQ